MKSLNKVSAFFWFATIFWMLLIFYLSSQPALISNSLSKRITILLFDMTKQVQGIDLISQKHVSEINSIIRQYAHGVVYAILTILVVNALRCSGMNVLKSSVIAFVISVAFACSDEIHQMFVPGRAVQSQDLLMDCTGVLLGLAIYVTYAFLCKK